MIKLNRLAILASFALRAASADKAAGKFYTHVTGNKELLMMSPTLMDMCKNNLIKSVEFEPTGEVLKSSDGTELKPYKVKVDGIVESNAGVITLAASIQSNGLTAADIELAKGLL